MLADNLHAAGNVHNNQTSPAAAPEAIVTGLTGKTCSSQSISSLLLAPCRAGGRPYESTNFEGRTLNSNAFATRLAMDTFSTEAAEELVGHLSACFPASVMQKFFDSLQPLTEAANMPARIAELVQTAWQFTLPELLKKRNEIGTNALMTPGQLKQLMMAMQETIEAPEFLSEMSPYQVYFGRTNQVITDGHKVLIVMLALVHFVFKDDHKPLYFSLASLAKRIGLGRSATTLKRLYFDYRRNRSTLEELLHQHKDQVDHAAVRNWVTFLTFHNHQREKNACLIQRYDQEFAALPSPLV